jgi:20S proteasome subunit beta 6
LLDGNIEHRRNQFNPYVNNGGTVVAIAGKDFVVVGGDSRLS